MTAPPRKQDSASVPAHPCVPGAAKARCSCACGGPSGAFWPLRVCIRQAAPLPSQIPYAPAARSPDHRLPWPSAACAVPSSAGAEMRRGLSAAETSFRRRPPSPAHRAGIPFPASRAHHPPSTGFRPGHRPLRPRRRAFSRFRAIAGEGAQAFHPREGGRSPRSPRRSCGRHGRSRALHPPCFRRSPCRTAARGKRHTRWSCPFRCARRSRRCGRRRRGRGL